MAWRNISWTDNFRERHFIKLPNKVDPKKHRRRSIRLEGYDYSLPGAYFITICAYGSLPIFGDIIEGGMCLNFLGKLAKQEWQRLPLRFPLVELGSFMVMPNHVHGIIILLGESERRVGTMILEEDRPTSTEEHFGRPVSGSVPTIVRSYKSSVTLRINRLRVHPDHPVWQRNYYEHVIRDTADLEQISTYIEYNPQRWNEDRLNPGSSS